eukprot:COSAG01_NODE_10407_length_2174_cov_7.993735_1_plen_56_part_10
MPLLWLWAVGGVSGISEGPRALARGLATSGQLLVAPNTNTPNTPCLREHAAARKEV